MDINRFRNAKGRITDSMSDVYSSCLNDDCFYFQLSEDDKEVMEQSIEFFKNLIEEKYDRAVSNIEFEDDGDDSCGGHLWTVEVDLKMNKITKRGDWQSQIKAIADKVSKNTDYDIKVKISNPLYKELKKTTFLKSLENEYGVCASYYITINGNHRECTLQIYELPF